MDYKDKYIKYKTKYLDLYNKIGGKKMKKYSKSYSKNTSTMENNKHSVRVSEPWFSLILLGLKTVEERTETYLHK